MDFDYLDEIKLVRPSKFAAPPLQAEESSPKEARAPALPGEAATETASESPHAAFRQDEQAAVPPAPAEEDAAAFAVEERPAPSVEPLQEDGEGIRVPGLKKQIILRYLCRELLLYFAVCFSFFFVVFFVNQILLLAQTILEQRVSLHKTVLLIVYCLPGIVAQSAPFATLVGFLMCLGRMGTDNEILILRASGLHYSAILRPVLCIGLLISVFSFVMNDYFLPLGLQNYSRLWRQIRESDPEVTLEADSVRKMGNTALVIGAVDGNHVDGLVLFDRDSSEQDRIIVARGCDVRESSAPGVMMQFDMGGATVFTLGRDERVDFDVMEAQRVQMNIFDSMFMDEQGELEPNSMTSYDLWEKITQMKQDLSVSDLRMNAYKLEFNKKFSIPFGSIFFALLAFPLSLIFGRRDGQTLGFIFGIIISVLYWAATILGQIFGVGSGLNGFWMMWGPNLLLGLAGIFLYLKLRKR
ncbi:MAG TPA: YjgP/YjgQ family permease [Treponema sp.]|nr:YjgP/YjgQ family permease [Treponema sp.]